MDCENTGDPDCATYRETPGDICELRRITVRRDQSFLWICNTSRVSTIELPGLVRNRGQTRSRLNPDWYSSKEHNSFLSSFMVPVDLNSEASAALTNCFVDFLNLYRMPVHRRRFVRFSWGHDLTDI